MTPPVPALSGAEVVRLFEKHGWEVVHRKGSHIIMVKPGHMATLSIPDHKEVAKGTLRQLFRAAGIA